MALIPISREQEQQRFDFEIDRKTLRQFESSIDAYREKKDPGGLYPELLSDLDEEALLKIWVKKRWRGIIEDQLEQLRDLFNQCESPIEQLLLLAVEIAAKEQSTIQDVFPCMGDEEQPYSDNWLRVYPQFSLDKYRVDFKFTYFQLECGFFDLEHIHEPGRGVKKRSVLVECDGHDFHERTREQVSKDKARDRKLQAEGYHILRFSGSEIWRDPFACAEEVLNFLTRKEGGV